MGAGPEPDCAAAVLHKSRKRKKVADIKRNTVRLKVLQVIICRQEGNDSKVRISNESHSATIQRVKIFKHKLFGIFYSLPHRFWTNPTFTI